MSIVHRGASPDAPAADEVLGREAGRVDDRGGAVAEVDEVGRVTETFVDEHPDSDHHHLLK